MAAHATTGWETGLDPALVARLARPLRRPGLISLAIVRRIHGAIEALLGRLSLLERFAHKSRALAAPETPIVHARSAALGTRGTPAPAGAAMAAAAEAPRPIVRGIQREIERTVERTIVVEAERAATGRPQVAIVGATSVERETALAPVHANAPSVDLVTAAHTPARRAPPVPPARPELPEPPARLAPPEPARLELPEPVGPSAPEASNASASPSNAATSVAPTLLEQPAPSARRPRMDAPIVRRAEEPQPEFVERVALAPRAPRPPITAGAAGPAVSPRADIAPSTQAVRTELALPPLAAHHAQLPATETSNAIASPSSSATSMAPALLEQAAPSARRSRMGAPIVRRAEEPQPQPQLVERVEPSSRAVAGIAVAPSAEAAVRSEIAAMRPLVVRAVAVTPESVAGDRTPLVALPRPPRASSRTPLTSSVVPAAPSASPAVHRAIAAPEAAAIVHARAPRAPRPPITAGAAGPVVSPRAGITRSYPPPRLRARYRWQPGRRRLRSPPRDESR
jgi:hypothetical protein